MSYSDTKLLYITIYFLTTLFAFLSQKRRKGILVFNFLPFFCAFLIHWIVLSFTNIGSDYYHYVRNIEGTALADLSIFDEVSFNGLCYLLYVITRSADVTIFIIKTIEIVILYYGFYRIRYSCSLGLAMFSYNAMIFLQSILLLSMHFAIVLLFLSFINLLEKKWGRASMLLLLSCTIHASSILLIPVYLLYLVYSTKDKKVSIGVIILVSIFSIYIVSRLNSIFEYALSNILFFQHYSNYSLIGKYEGSGLMQIIYFVPILYFSIIIFCSSFDNSIKNAAVFFPLMAFVCAMLGYKMEVFARMNMNFWGLYSVLIPMTLFAQKYNTESFKIRTPYYMNLLLWIAILSIRAYFVFYANMTPDSETEIQYYNFYNPFK